MCGLKNLWAFNRLLPYCFETVQSDISYVALRTADRTNRPGNKGRNTKITENKKRVTQRHDQKKRADVLEQNERW